MNTTLFLRVAFVLLYASPIAVIASDRAVMRPSILPILQGRDLSTIEASYDEMCAVIETATRFWTKSDDGYLPSDIDTIVLVERSKDWLVAYFRRGNGRSFTTENGEPMIPTQLETNPLIVVVTKLKHDVSYSQENFALGWAPLIFPRISTSYPDQNVMEKMQREGRLNARQSKQ